MENRRFQIFFGTRVFSLPGRRLCARKPSRCVGRADGVVAWAMDDAVPSLTVGLMALGTDYWPCVPPMVVSGSSNGSSPERCTSVTPSGKSCLTRPTTSPAIALDTPERFVLPMISVSQP